MEKIFRNQKHIFRFLIEFEILSENIGIIKHGKHFTPEMEINVFCPDNV